MKMKFDLFFYVPFISVCSFFTSPLHAQQPVNIPIRLKAVDQKKEPVPFVSFTVKNRIDSLQTQTKVADSTGSIVFILHKDAQYIVSITAVNYQPVEKGITATGSQPSFTYVLDPLSKSLSRVVVTAQRPLIRQEDDKTIVDVENLAASSTNGYEVIEKTPGLFVDQDGNIYIASTTPASVHINGREIKMSAADIATMLKSLPPNTIDKIEILRTPSAKYDASGSGGLVNVVLKKGVKIGFTGSINTGWQQGTYGNKFAGFSINNTSDKKSYYVNFNYTRRVTYERILTDRLFAPDSMLSQNAHTVYSANSYFAGYGLTYTLSRKWSLDVNGSLTLNDFDNNSNNYSEIKKTSTSQLITSNLNSLINNGSSLVVSNGAEAKLKIDSAGSEWTTDLSFTHSRNNSDQVFATNYSLPVVASTSGDGNSDNNRSYLTVKSDLKLKMRKKLTLETGAKIAVLGFKSETHYFREEGGNRIKDFYRTNTFHYEENINSIYLQGAQTFGRNIILKIGTRLENTNMRGKQMVPMDTSFTIRRTDLFPYVFLSKKIMAIAGYELRGYLVYRRTINRPVYEQLNPFPRYVDQYLSEVGNPALRPQFTTNYEFNISVDERPIIAAGVNETKDIFTNVIYQADSSQSQAYRTYDNLGKNKEWYLRALGAIPPGGKYFFVVVAQYNHNMYDGYYQNKPLVFKKGTWTFYTYHLLKLDKRSQLTVNGFIRLKGQQQLYEIEPFGALNTSINRKFLNDKLVVTFSMQDIFATTRNHFTINQGSVHASGTRLGDTRRFGVNLRYNFGLRKKEENTNMFNIDTPEKSN